MEGNERRWIWARTGSLLSFKNFRFQNDKVFSPYNKSLRCSVSQRLRTDRKAPFFHSHFPEDLLLPITYEPHSKIPQNIGSVIRLWADVKGKLLDPHDWEDGFNWMPCTIRQTKSKQCDLRASSYLIHLWGLFKKFYSKLSGLNLEYPLWRSLASAIEHDSLLSIIDQTFLVRSYPCKKTFRVLQGHVKQKNKQNSAYNLFDEQPERKILWRSQGILGWN